MNSLTDKIYSRLLELYQGAQSLSHQGDIADFQHAKTVATNIKNKFGTLSKEQLANLFTADLNSLKETLDSTEISDALYSNIKTKKVTLPTFIYPINKKLKESSRKSINYKILSNNSNYKNYSFLVEDNKQTNDFEQISINKNLPIIKNLKNNQIYVQMEAGNDASLLISTLDGGTYSKYLRSKSSPAQGVPSEESQKIFSFATAIAASVLSGIILEAKELFKEDEITISLIDEILNSVNSLPGVIIDSIIMGVLDIVNILESGRGSLVKSSLSKQAGFTLKNSPFKGEYSLVKGEVPLALENSIASSLISKLDEILSSQDYLSTEIIHRINDSRKFSNTTAQQKFKGFINIFESVLSLIIKQLKVAVGVTSSDVEIEKLIGKSIDEIITYAYFNLKSDKEQSKYGSAPFIQLNLVASDNYPLLIEYLLHYKTNSSGEESYTTSESNKSAGLSSYLNEYIKYSMQLKKQDTADKYIEVFDSLKTSPASTFYYAQDAQEVLNSLIRAFYKGNGKFDFGGNKKALFVDCPRFLKDIESVKLITSDSLINIKDYILLMNDNYKNHILPLLNRTPILADLYITAELTEEEIEIAQRRAARGDVSLEDFSGEIRLVRPGQNSKLEKEIIQEYNFKSLKEFYIDYMNKLADAPLGTDIIQEELGQKVINIITNIRNGFWSCDAIENRLGIYNPYKLASKENENTNCRLSDKMFKDPMKENILFLNSVLNNIKGIEK